MRWTKIKNIILLLLVIVNLALLALVGLRSWQSMRNERLARERMVEILQNNNIEFLPDQVPDRMKLTPLRLTAGEGNGICPAPEGTVFWSVQNGRGEPVELAGVTGTWEAGAARGETIDGSTALLRLLETVNREGYVFSQITDMYPGYVVSGASPMQLTPTWFIEIDTRPWRFAVDGYTGAVSAAAPQ